MFVGMGICCAYITSGGAVWTVEVDLLLDRFCEAARISVNILLIISEGGDHKLRYTSTV